MNRFNKYISAVCAILIVASPCIGQVERETWQPPETIMDPIVVKPDRLNCE